MHIHHPHTPHWALGLLSAAALAALPASLAMASPSPSVSLSVSTHQVPLGGQAVFTAQADNVAPSALYQFWVESPAGHWADAQNYSPSRTLTLAPPMAGGYVVVVDVLTPSQVAAGDWSQAITTTPAALYVDSSVSLSTPSGPYVKGQTATVTATAANVPGAQYQFWVESPAGQWTGGAYGSARTDSISMPAAGTYRVVAYAKAPGAPGDAAGALESPVATWSAAAGPGSSVELQGGKISASNPVVLAANQPVALTIVNVDAGGNPIPILGTAPGIFQLPSLAGLSGTAEWEPAGGGVPITTVTIPPAASSATVWLVASEAQVVDSLPPAVRTLVVTTKALPHNTVQVSVAGIPNGLGADEAKLTTTGSVTAAVSDSLTSDAALSGFPLAVSDSGTAVFDVTGSSSRNPQVYTLTIAGVSAQFSMTLAPV